MNTEFEIVEGSKWELAKADSLRHLEVVRIQGDELETFIVCHTNMGLFIRLAELGRLEVLRKQEKKLVVTLEIPVSSMRRVGVDTPWEKDSCSLNVEWYGGKLEVRGSYDDLVTHGTLVREAVGQN